MEKELQILWDCKKSNWKLKISSNSWLFLGCSGLKIFLDFPFQSSSVTQLCPTLCDPMNHSTPGLPVHHQLPESTQTHVHWVGDAIQPSHPLSSPSPPALNLSQHQGLFQWLSSALGGQSAGVSSLFFPFFSRLTEKKNYNSILLEQ